MGIGSMSFGDDLSKVVEKVFQKALPIPRTPRYYRPPMPNKPLSWIPKGKLGDQNYETRLKEFAGEIREINSQRTSKVRPSSRGWCYLLEGLQKIDKGEFSSCQGAINDCRKLGLLPIDFVADDQDETRHFQGIIETSDPARVLDEWKEQIEKFIDDLPSLTTDYWKGEKYYVMMCVEKGDILHLFEPVCREYKVRIVSSKGWPPISVRAHIANLSKRAEKMGLTPVVLLFYDHDPAGLKISEKFRKNLEDCSGGTGWHPDKLIIERFGLNEDDIDRYGLTWIENITTGSGREANDPKYVQRFGRRKCESNALFKNDETLRAGEQICRKAIEKYYGKDALKRFQMKEQPTKQKLKPILENDAWRAFSEWIEQILNCLAQPMSKEVKESKGGSYPAEKEVEVSLDSKHYGLCPRCKEQFDYSESYEGKLVRCRSCHLSMRLKLARDSSDESIS